MGHDEGCGPTPRRWCRERRRICRRAQRWEVTSGTISTTGPGAPQYLPVFTAEEETTITGVPTLDATWYSAAADQRVEVSVELGGGGMTLAPGETLCLVVSPFVELYFGHGSARTPGAVALEDMLLNLPAQR